MGSVCRFVQTLMSGQLSKDNREAKDAFLDATHR